MSCHVINTLRSHVGSSVPLEVFGRWKEMGLFAYEAMERQEILQVSQFN